MTTVNRIPGQTVNAKVKAFIKENFTGVTGLTKRHVAGMGYVFYIKRGEMTIGKVFKERREMVVYNDNK